MIVCCTDNVSVYRLLAYRHNFAFIGIGFHRSDTTDIHVALTAHAYAIYHMVLTLYNLLTSTDVNLQMS